MNIEERYIFDSYMLSRNVQLECIRVPVGDKGAERNEFILWPSVIVQWPETLSLGDYYTVQLYSTALESERQGVFERIKTAHKGSGSGGADRMIMLDPVEFAEQFEA